MKIAVLHISDMHFRQKGETTACPFELIDKLVASISTALIDRTHVLIVISGDIAFSGNEKEYDYAADWLSTLYLELSEVADASFWLLIAPGNHDVDHSTERPLRTAIVEQLRGKPTLSFNSEVIEQCTTEQTAFFRFQDGIESDSLLVYRDPMLRIHSIRDENTVVQINIFNSAWMSSRNEMPGTLIYPIEKYRDQLARPDGFSISVMHHPMSWFETENQRRLRANLSQCSSIVLFGHEHIPDTTRLVTHHGDHVRFIDGGILWSDESEESSFNLILLNTTECTLKDLTFVMHGDRYVSSDDGEWSDATRLTSAESDRFRLLKPVRESMDELGINVIHPRKERLLLRDLFVYPDLTSYDNDEANDSDMLEVLQSAESLLFDQSDTHAILIGDENLGKTALLRTLFSEFYHRGKVPLYIDELRASPGRPLDLKNEIEKTFKKTYGGEDYLAYDQLNCDERVLLLDNLVVEADREEQLHECMQFIRKYFGRGVLATSDMASVQRLTTGAVSRGYDGEYSLYYIQEFGHVKRDELIKRWILLGRSDLEWNSPSILEEREKARKVINTTIGRRLMPSIPLIVLIILQSREAGSSNPVGSTYGHHYQFLITRSLIHAGVRVEDLDAISNYLAELAYQEYFTKRAKSVSSREFFVWHEGFSIEYGVNWIPDEILNKLIAANILNRSFDDRVGFKHQYVYFFYLAQRLSRSLDEEDVQKRVKFMCDRLHIAEYANVVLFLIHHSNDEFVLSAIKGSATALLKDKRTFGFDVGERDELLAAINRLQSGIRVKILEDRDPEEEQERALRNQDDLERNHGTLVEQYEENHALDSRRMDALDELAQAGVAAKTVELLGQTLRNYYGSLKITTKVEMSRDALELAMRALYTFFDVLSIGDFGLVGLLKERRREYEKENLKPFARKDEDKLERWARDIVFGIFRAVGYVIVRKVASALGSEQLKPTLRELVPDSASVTYKMVEIAALLDGPTDIPREKLEALAHSLGNNPLGFEVLRDLVRHRVYRYPTDYRDKQWLSSKLKFSMSRQRSAELDGSRRLLPSQEKDGMG